MQMDNKRLNNKAKALITWKSVPCV